MNWIKEEIENSREIATYFRKEIKYGDWYIYDVDEFLKPMPMVHADMQYPVAYEMDAIPLWSLTDCLEWLEEKGFILVNLSTYDIGYSIRTKKVEVDVKKVGITPTSAAQLAVLEILKGK